MSNTKNQYDKERPYDGGQAFPRIGHVNPQDIEPDQWIKGAEGMTLRDYFAAEAMNQMIPGILKPGDESRANDTARWAYVFADAMLKAREQ